MNLPKLIPFLSIFVIFSANVLNASPTEFVDATVDKGDEKIVGGENAIPHEFPWLVNINSNLGFCGGSVLNENWILTAAHCVTSGGSLPSGDVTVTAGDHIRNQSNNLKQIVRSVKVIPHQGYSELTLQNDIALIKLRTPLESTTGVKALTPPASPSQVNSGAAIVAGWGTLREGGSVSNTLQKVELDLVSLSTCRNSYGEAQITDNMMCAARPGKDSCQGDSGGPLLCSLNNNPANTYVCGIVSFGNGCARPNYPGVYTKVSSYLSWIQNVLDSDANEVSSTTPETPDPPTPETPDPTTPNSVSSLAPGISLLTALIFLTTFNPTEN